MKTAQMMKLLLISLLGLSVSSAWAFRYKGYIETDNLVRSRMIKAGAKIKTSDPKLDKKTEERFELGKYIEEAYGQGSFSTTLLDLLGTYKSTGVSKGFRNGDPNGMSMLLWTMIFQGFSMDIAKLCGQSSSAIFEDDVVNAVHALCAWPASSALNQNLWMDLWTFYVGYEAPESEFTLWYNTFIDDNFWRTQPADVLIQSAAMSAFLNPYLLLRH